MKQRVRVRDGRNTPRITNHTCRREEYARVVSDEMVRGRRLYDTRRRQRRRRDAPLTAEPASAREDKVRLFYQEERHSEDGYYYGLRTRRRRRALLCRCARRAQMEYAR